jgi:hypothetical protein
VQLRTGLSLPARRYPDPTRVIRPGTRFGAAELILRHGGSRLEMRAGEAGTTWTFELAVWSDEAKKHRSASADQASVSNQMIMLPKGDGSIK